MAQTSMHRYTDPAVPGLVASPMYRNTILGGLLAPSAGISAGTYASRDSGDLVKAPTSAAEVLQHGLGFVIADQSKATVDGTAPTYKSGEDLPVFAHGPGIWVLCAEAMSVDDPIYIITVSTDRGKARNDADSGNATLLPGARVRKVATTFAGQYLALVDMEASSVAGPTGPTGPTGP